MRQDIRQSLGKTVVVFLFITVIFLIIDNKLGALMLASFVPVVAYHWDSRWYFILALIFLFSTPIFLIFSQDKQAEQMAVYTYYLLCLGVAEQIVEYIRYDRDKAKPIKEEITTWAKLNASGLLLLAVISLFGIGFYYINNKFNTAISEQNDLIMRIGGYKIREDDKETAKLVKQMQEVMNTYSRAMYDNDELFASTLSGSSNTGTSSNKAITSNQTNTQSVLIKILNGTTRAGLAGDLQKKLSILGYNISGTGNAVGEYVTTTVYYSSVQTLDQKKLTQAIYAEVNKYYYAQLAESNRLKNNEIEIIIGSQTR